MKSTFEVKNTKADTAPLDVDLNAGIVKVVWSTLGVTDYDNDIMDQGCFTKTIAERGPMGTNLIAALIDHNPSVKKMYGKPKELYVEGSELIAVIPVVKTELGKDLMIQYAAGIINQQSVGFSTIRDEEDRNTGIRVIKEVKLYEGSAVLWGANWMTPTMDVVRTQGKNAAIEYMVKREGVMMKTMRNCDFTDETHLLLEIQLKQLQATIDAVKTGKLPMKDENCPECGNPMEDDGSGEMVCMMCTPKKNEKFATELQKMLSLLS